MEYLTKPQLRLMLDRSLKYILRPWPRQRIVRNPPAAPPRISVIIPTFNWSNVLKLAISTVLWQTEQDFEIVVVGDACTDNSESVVRSFGDARIRWHNLSVNTGSQSGPNNAGLAMASGQYVAYLGHDDVWHPEHLRTMLAAIESSGADVASALVEMIGPKGTNFRVVTGWYPPEGYRAKQGLPPSGLMHRREVSERIEGWRDHRTVWRNPDTDFVCRAFEAGCTFVSTGELTVFKFNSSLRKNSYREKRDREQKAYIRRIRRSGMFLLKETLDIAWVHHRRLPMKTPEFAPPPHEQTPGWSVQQYRKFRGLE